jgi:hypothetical protein
VLEGWRAYNITSDKHFGIGDWSDGQLANFLSSANAQDRGAAAGPMAEAVENTLQYLTSEDIGALVAYLRTVAPQTGGHEVCAASAPGAQEPQDELGRYVSKVVARTVMNITAMAGRRSMLHWPVADRWPIPTAQM